MGFWGWKCPPSSWEASTQIIFFLFTSTWLTSLDFIAAGSRMRYFWLHSSSLGQAASKSSPRGTPLVPAAIYQPVFVALWGVISFQFYQIQQVSSSVLLGLNPNYRPVPRTGIKVAPKGDSYYLERRGSAVSPQPWEVPALTVEAWACSVSSEVSGGTAELKSLGDSLGCSFLLPGGSSWKQTWRQIELLESLWEWRGNSGKW